MFEFCVRSKPCNNVAYGDSSAIASRNAREFGSLLSFSFSVSLHLLYCYSTRSPPTSPRQCISARELAPPCNRQLFI